MKLLLTLLCTASLLVIVTSCEDDKSTAPTQPTTPAAKVSFSQIQPIIASKCATCHSSAQKAGGVVLEVPATISSMGSRINSKVSSGSMPPSNSGYSLTAQEKSLINNWVAQGASTN